MISSWQRVAGIGGAIWLAALATIFAPLDYSKFVVVTVAFGFLVVVPLAHSLPLEQLSSRARLIYLLSALSALLALQVPIGWFAGVLAVPILLYALWRFRARFLLLLAERSFRNSLECIASLFFVVATTWLGIARGVGGFWRFPELIVILTTAHFTFAGFAMISLFSRFDRALEDAALSRIKLFRALVAGTVLCIPLVALGITFSKPLESVSALVLSLLLLFYGLLSFPTLPELNRPVFANALLAISIVCLELAMVLAGLFAASHLFPVPLASIQFMIATHAPLNAYGFVFLALCSWQIGRQSSSPTQ